jgi:hypothetical protein
LDAAKRKEVEDSIYYLIEGYITLKRRQGSIRANMLRPTMAFVLSSATVASKDGVTLNFKVYFRDSSDDSDVLGYSPPVWSFEGASYVARYESGCCDAACSYVMCAPL